MVKKASPKNPILVALDVTDVEVAKKLVRTLDDIVFGFKLGLEFFCANGTTGVADVMNDDQKFFLDLKLHDIPNTAAAAAAATMHLEPQFLSLHCSGGGAMLEAAVQAVNNGASQWKRPMLLGVTVLTSLPATAQTVLEHAKLAKDCGLDGVVCSPYEVALLRRELGPTFKLVAAGIRPTKANSRPDDQHRFATPLEAIKAGADFIVIGRPITAAPNPRHATQGILDALK